MTSEVENTRANQTFHQMNWFPGPPTKSKPITQTRQKRPQKDFPLSKCITRNKIPNFPSRTFSPSSSILNSSGATSITYEKNYSKAAATLGTRKTNFPPRHESRVLWILARKSDILSLSEKTRSRITPISFAIERKRDIYHGGQGFGAIHLIPG